MKFKELLESIKDLNELSQETYEKARKGIVKKMNALSDDEPSGYHPWPSQMKKEPKIDAETEAELGKLAKSFIRASRGASRAQKSTWHPNAIGSKQMVGEDVQDLSEVLDKSAPIKDWVHDFVHSDNPKFKGKTKEERRKMALAAYYAAHGKS